MVPDQNDISAGADVAVLPGLPEGFFVVNAKAQFTRTGDATPTVVHCALNVEDAANVTGPFTDLAEGSLIAETRTTLPLAMVADLPSGGIAILHCQGTNVEVSNATLTAIQVGTLTATLP